MALSFESIRNFFLGSATGTLDANFSKIADEFDETLRRDGSNVMRGNLDMDGRRIINHGAPKDDGDLATVAQVRDYTSKITQGPPGTSNNTYTSYAALLASDGSRRSAQLVNDPVEPDGTFYYRNGSWQRQDTAAFAYGAGTLKDRLDNEVWVTDFFPKSVLESIKAGGNVNATPYVQAAIDYIGSVGGGLIRYPKLPAALKMNVVNKHQVSHVGSGRGNTVWTPWTNAPVFRTPVSSSCNNFRVENLTIFGNMSFANQHGIQLETTGAGNFVDTVRLANLDIRNCGNHGLYVRGTSSSGPFVQRLYVDDCEIGSNYRNVAILGCVIEACFHQTSLCIANSSDSGRYSVLIDFAGDSIPARINFTGGTIFSCPGGTALLVGGIETLLCQGSSFEFSNPAIRIVDFSLIRNVIITANSFASIEASQNQIWVSQCKGLQITNNSFSAGSTITDAIFLDGSGAAIPWPILYGNTATGTGVTNLVTDQNGLIVPLMGSSIRAYRSLMTIGGSGNLTNILDERGTLNTFVRGDTRIMLLSAGGTIVVKHGVDNIFLSGATDYTISPGKSLTLVYVGGAWFEAGRSG